MSLETDAAALDAALRQVLVDLSGRPLSGALVLAYWMVMTNMLTTVYEADEDALVKLLPAARALKVQTAPAAHFLN